MREEAKRTETVVEADQDDTPSRQAAAVGKRLRASAAVIPLAVTSYRSARRLRNMQVQFADDSLDAV